MTLVDIGQSIPANTPHAVSVCLPTWEAMVGYEEGEDWVLSKMRTGYPRFFIHKSIQALAREILAKYGSENEDAMLFPSMRVAKRCVQFFQGQDDSLQPEEIRIIELRTSVKEFSESLQSDICAVIYPASKFKLAPKPFWQHTGDGISSRRAEYCLKALKDGQLLEKGAPHEAKSNDFAKGRGPRRYQRGLSKGSEDAPKQKIIEGDHTQFVEERFGRNLHVSLVDNAKTAIKRRIAGSLTADVGLCEAVKLPGNAEDLRPVSGFSEDNVYLYPTGMSAIFNTHRALLMTKKPLKSICFGFPYVDTLKILEKFGPGCLFYGNAAEEDLDDLESRLASGERYLALFCEFPGNPLLKSANMKRIHDLSKKYDFAVVIDETVGNFINVNVLPYADVVVSSLTKVFSGDSNVMGGSAALNPNGKDYAALRKTLEEEYEDNYWAEDAIFMERNSRDFVTRIHRINETAEAVCNLLKSHPRVKEVYYPKFSPTRANYDFCRNENGGYGGLFSVTFYSTAEAVVFFDKIDVQKGPSLGTNFTLSCPYTILAHYGELEWAAQFGVERDLVRVSVGLEDTPILLTKFQEALDTVSELELA